MIHKINYFRFFRFEWVSYVELDTKKRFVYLINIFTVSAMTIADIYKQLRHVELFSRWIKSEHEGQKRDHQIAPLDLSQGKFSMVRRGT
jgi:hypothetical protein